MKNEKTVFSLYLNLREVFIFICWSFGFSHRGGKGIESALPSRQWRPHQSSCMWARRGSGTAHCSCTVWLISHSSARLQGRRSRRSVGTFWSFPSQCSPVTWIPHNSCHIWVCMNTEKKLEEEKCISKSDTMSVFRWQENLKMIMLFIIVLIRVEYY